LYRDAQELGCAVPAINVATKNRKRLPKLGILRAGGEKSRVGVA
jgi:hypothetical protein